ncbi:hypothetical protein IWW42_002680 [Coemansia sp. RSA 1085]|nr:hypothetical protein IWW42_002680 [Coemansia sp. RSA 1085]
MGLFTSCFGEAGGYKGTRNGRRGVTKAMIGAPSNFVHTGHLGIGAIQSGGLPPSKDPQKLKALMSQVRAALDEESLTTPRTEFPTHGLLPRADTQAAEFVRKYPKYDGRGTVAAVLDTGIDPGAKGLQVTSDGKRKMLDFIDCTGAGDVALSDAKTSPNLELRGGSGRLLRLNPEWENPTGNWYLGMKLLYDLLPGDVRANVKRDRTEQFERKAQQLADMEDSDKDDPEAKARVESLKKLSEMYKDEGPILDCVVFHDGTQWRAAIDVDESGELSHAAALGAYKSTGDVGLLCRKQLFYYTLNFYDQGRTLSIVTCAGTHATHVAGILAAYHPDEPENSGVAPGAQVLSLMIGDHRVGSMETGVGLTRAVNAIVEYGADVANMSYGEPSATSNRGQWIQAVSREVVQRHRCVFVSSAGNEGPALSTVGSPGGTTDDVIGVGAYVCLEQMQAEYGMYKEVNDAVFTWSSRGPTPDGDSGVNIYAPGSAITSFPAYTRERLHLANGTSMSSPNLCGIVALLISAWKQEIGGERISPFRVRNAIERTGKAIGELHGAGLVQTDDAWQFMKKYVKRTFEDVRYTISIDDTSIARGIYLREPEESANVRFFKIMAAPVFPTSPEAQAEKDPQGEHGQQENKLKFDFEQRVLLVPSVSWVQVPNAIYVSSIGNTFTARVDPTQLEAGRLHTATIDAYDSDCVDRGPIFSVPITVTKPLKVDDSATVELGTIRFRPADIARHFIGVPVGATRAEITMEADNSVSQAVAPSIIYLHCLQLAPESRFRKHWLLQRVSIGHKTFGSGGSTTPQRHRSMMPVTGGVTLEVCLAQFWNQVDMHDVKVTVKFNGLVPVSSGGGAFADSGMLEPALVLNGNHLVARAEITSLVRPEYSIKPSATLDRFQRPLRPNKATIFPLTSERDTHLLTGTAIQCLELEYKLEISKDKTSVRFFMPAVDTQIYESWADNFAFSVFDANKRRVATQINYTSLLSLPRQGEYLIRAHIRHRSAKDLEALKDAPLLVEFTLASSITLPIEYSLASVFTDTVGSSTYRGGFLPKGGRAALFFNLCKKVPGEVAPGDILRGSLTLNNVTAKLGIEMIVPAKTKVANETAAEKPLAQEDQDESPAAREQRELEKELRRVRLSWVSKVKEDSVRDALVSELTSSSSDDEQRAEALAAHLKALDDAPSSLPWTEAAHLADDRAQRILEVASELSELVRPLALTARLYESAESDEEKRERKRAEQARSHMRAALQSRCRALAALTSLTSCSTTASEDSAEFVHVDSSTDVTAYLRDYEKAAAEMRQWTDSTTSAAYLIATLPLFIAKHQYARALKGSLDWLEKAPLQASNATERKSMAELRDQMLGKLQWSIWLNHFHAIAPIVSPNAYEKL